MTVGGLVGYCRRRWTRRGRILRDGAGVPLVLLLAQPVVHLRLHPFFSFHCFLQLGNGGLHVGVLLTDALSQATQEVQLYVADLPRGHGVLQRTPENFDLFFLAVVGLVLILHGLLWLRHRGLCLCLRRLIRIEHNLVLDRAWLALPALDLFLIGGGGDNFVLHLLEGLDGGP